MTGRYPDFKMVRVKWPIVLLGICLMPLRAYAQESSMEQAEQKQQRRCVPTADNILGPYYRPNSPFRTQLAAADEEGIPLAISGRVLDTDCNPIEGAVVEIWQTNHRGEYDNDSPNFRFRGQTKTDAGGRYQFAAIVPGRYAIGERITGYGSREAVYRPRHGHFKVTKPRFRNLITQLYFKGDPYNAVDPHVVDSLIFEPEKSGSGTEERWSVVFDLVLKKAR